MLTNSACAAAGDASRHRAGLAAAPTGGHVNDLGPRTADQLTQNLRGPEITLSEETLRELDEIWPGPGGDAPEGNAW